MAATTIYFNGRLISIPGPYTEVDASGLEVVGLSASGIVACVGTAIGGKPYTEITGSDVKTQLEVATNPQKPFDFYRSGHLKEAGPILFSPADDDEIQGGAQEIVYVKVNPAVQSVATFPNAAGDAITLTSRDWGYFITQINVEIGAGTNQGKMVTLTFEDTEEVFDDVGGDDLFTLTYLATTPAEGYDTITATVSSTAIYTEFTLARAGLDSEITNPVTATQAVELVSDDAGDTTQTVTLYGLDTSNAAQWETLSVNGLSVVTGNKTWNEIHGAIIDGAPAGTVTVRNLSGGTTILTLTAGAMTKGLHVMSEVSVAGVVLDLVRGAAGTEKLVVVGKNASGGAQYEAVTLNGSTPVATTGTWSSITYLAFGAVAAAGTVTASAKSVNAPFTGIDTLQKAADRFNGTPGYTFTLATAETAFEMENLDYVTAEDILSPAAPGFEANLYAVVNELNLKSGLVTAARAIGGTGAPSNTTAPVYLSGGHEGSSTPGAEGTPTATNADWQAAINLLTKVRVNIVVVMTHDPAIHAMVKAHVKYMGGVGRSERDTKLGLQNTGLTDHATKTEIKSQIRDLNSKYCAAWAQSIERFNTDGDRETLTPMYGALVLAGMQAGTPVGTPVTHKGMNTLSLAQDSTWNPTDDAEEMIQAGLCFGEVVDGAGTRRVVRGVTTHLSSSNIAYVEQSVVEAWGYAVYNYRTTMESVVGRKGFAGTVQAAHAEAIGALGLLVGVAIVAYRSLSTSLTLDVLEQAVEIAPVLPINFVKSTIHLVSVPQSSAAA